MKRRCFFPLPLKIASGSVTIRRWRRTLLLLCWIWDCIIFIGFEEKSLNSLLDLNLLLPILFSHLLVVVEVDYQVKLLLSNKKKRQWLETISQINKERTKEKDKKKLTEWKNSWTRSSWNLFSDQKKKTLFFFQIPSLSVLSSQIRVAIKREFKEEREGSKGGKTSLFLCYFAKMCRLMWMNNTNIANGEWKIWRERERETFQKAEGFFFPELTRADPINPSNLWPAYYTGSTTGLGLKTMHVTLHLLFPAWSWFEALIWLLSRGQESLFSSQIVVFLRLFEIVLMIVI